MLDTEFRSKTTEGEWLEGEETYGGKKHRLRTVIQSQARHVATYVRGEARQYKPFVGRW
jgi:CRISPR-associated protein Cas1